MKLKVNELAGVVRRDDGMVNVGFKAGDTVYSLLLSFGQVSKLMVGLLASTPDPLSPTAIRLRPQGIGRFQIDAEIGLSLFLEREVALHILLSRPLASEAVRLIETFDDPSTWDGPNRPN